MPSNSAIDVEEQTAREQWFREVKESLDFAASAMENQKAAIIEIQLRLRDECKKHLS